jgi:hypothetical protein
MVCSGRYGQGLRNGNLEVGEVVRVSGELDTNVLGEKWGRRSLHHPVAHGLSAVAKSDIRSTAEVVLQCRSGLTSQNQHFGCKNDVLACL